MYTPKQYAEALHSAIAESNPKGQEKVIENLVSVLKANGHLGMISEIEAAFYEADRQGRGVQQAEVTSARELTGTAEQKLISQLNDHVGGKVELKKKIDEGLLGGVVIKVGDELIDGSVHRYLQDLKSKLIE